MDFELSKFYDNHIECNKIRDGNNEIYQKYIDDVIYWKLKKLKEVSGNINPSSILEVGCGIGFLIANAPFDTKPECRTGIDISSKNIEYAKKNFPLINFYAIDFEEFFRNNNKKYDLIILSDIIEHVINDKKLIIYAGDKSENVLINLPLEKCYEYKNRNFGFEDFEGHLRAYDYNDAIQLIKDCGLEIINFKVERYVEQPVFRKYLLRKIIGLKGKNIDSILEYLEELNSIDLNKENYKSNFFALLKKSE